jgi:hypothetical protein
VIIVLLGLLCLGKGVEILERGYEWFYPGLGVLTCGAAVVTIFQYIFKDGLFKDRLKATVWLLCIGALLLEIWFVWALRGAQGNRFSMAGLLLAWLGVFLLLGCAAYIGDRLRSKASDSVDLVEVRPILGESWSRVDSLVALILFAVAFWLRASGPMTGVTDEIWVLGEFGGLLNNPKDKFWGVSGMSFPYLLHWMNAGIYKLVQGFFGKMEYLKLSVAAAAALSVPTLFGVVRIFAPRSVAFTAGLALTFMGWHWVNSRFMYVYPYDIGLIGLGVWLSVVAFEKRRFSAAVGVGFLWVYTLLATKISIVLIPFTLVLALDYQFRGSRKDKLAIAKLCAVIVMVAVLAYAPVLIDNTRGLYSSSSMSQGLFWRYQQAVEAKRLHLERFELNQFSAFFYVYFDVFRQFLFVSKDFYRHYFRPLEPLLDPASAALFMLGLVFAIAYALRRRDCRIAIYGLLIFILPAVLAFPLDSGEKNALARRFVGTSFFLAWLISMGAYSVAKLIFHGTARHVVVVASGFIIALFNLYLYQAVYLSQGPKNWLAHQGLDIAAMMREIENGQRMGAKVIVLNGPWVLDHNVLSGFKPVDVVGSTAEVRNLISSSPAGLVYVVIPAATPGRAYHVRRTIEELADVVAPTYWRPGYKAPQGYPLNYNAIVERLP